MGVLLLVRHGQASYGAEDYDVLSDAGAEQSRVLGRVLAAQGLEAAAVVHGAMRRQRDTATLLAESAGWAVSVELDEGWDEFDHLGVAARGPSPDAHLEDRRTFQQAFDAATARWSSGEHDEEYAETWSAFVARVTGALDRACERDGVTVVVSSGGPIAVVCATLVEPAATPAELPRYWHRFNTVTLNAAVTRILVGSTDRRLLSFNEHSHLPQHLVTHR
jgi:broad specificity phosphatase PhoE